MRIENPDYDRFESIVPKEAIREIYRRNDVYYMVREHRRILRLCLTHGYADSEESANRFTLGFIFHMREKYSLRIPLHPVSYPKGYRFVRRLR